jgi:hypothetical protein
MITIIIIYSLFVTPFIVVYPEVYEYCTVTDGGLETTTNYRQGCQDGEKNPTLF